MAGLGNGACTARSRALANIDRPVKDIQGNCTDLHSGWMGLIVLKGQIAIPGVLVG